MTCHDNFNDLIKVVNVHKAIMRNIHIVVLFSILIFIFEVRSNLIQDLQNQCNNATCNLELRV